MKYTKTEQEIFWETDLEISIQTEMLSQTEYLL